MSCPPAQPDQLPPAALTGTVFYKLTVFLVFIIGGLFLLVLEFPCIVVIRFEFSFQATDKVALLIGNLNYSNHPDLMAPIMDVHELANLLQQLDFRVVSLLDLTIVEMQSAVDKFIQLLDRGVYGEHFAFLSFSVSI